MLTRAAVHTKALIVIDMQEEYAGQTRDKKRYPYNAGPLIDAINVRIAGCKRNNDLIVYVKNSGKSPVASPFVPALQLVSGLVFEKNKASCFSGGSLLAHLREQKISQIELAGVDGNYCVGMSALDGAKLGFSICVRLSCVGVANAKKFASTKEKLIRANVSVLP